MTIDKQYHFTVYSLRNDPKIPCICRPDDKYYYLMFILLPDVDTIQTA